MIFKGKGWNLGGIRGQYDLVYRNRIFYLVIVQDIPEAEEEYQSKGVFGIDLGENNSLVYKLVLSISKVGNYVVPIFNMVLGSIYEFRQSFPFPFLVIAATMTATFLTSNTTDL